MASEEGSEWPETIPAAWQELVKRGCKLVGTVVKETTILAVVKEIQI